MLTVNMREAARASVAKSRQALQPTTRNVLAKRNSKSLDTDFKAGPDHEIKVEADSPQKSLKTSRKRRLSTEPQSTPLKKLKSEDDVGVKEEPTSPSNSPIKSKKSSASDLQSKKLKTYAQYANQSPFPDFVHPTAAEAKLAHRILTGLHGAKNRPKEVVASTTRAGCGDSPSVLDALVRTILSQNTSDTNSSRAKRSMDQAYGASDKWDAIVEGGEAKLQEAIKCGGLSQVKSKVIISILRQTQEKYGKYSLDHLHEASNEDAMNEMLAFQGVGPKTASCVLLFCLQRESFAVDTHVWRISGLLGWRPKSASRDETHAHLDVRIPDEDKFGLHILMVSHGKQCDECKAGGKNLGNCELRKAFRKGKVEGQAGEDVKEEEVDQIKQEGGDVKDIKSQPTKRKKKG